MDLQYKKQNIQNELESYTTLNPNPKTNARY